MSYCRIDDSSLDERRFDGAGFLDTYRAALQAKDRILLACGLKARSSPDAIVRTDVATVYPPIGEEGRAIGL